VYVKSTPSAHCCPINGIRHSGQHENLWRHTSKTSRAKETQVFILPPAVIRTYLSRFDSDADIGGGLFVILYHILDYRLASSDIVNMSSLRRNELSAFVESATPFFRVPTNLEFNTFRIRYLWVLNSSWILPCSCTWVLWTKW